MNRDEHESASECQLNGGDALQHREKRMGSSEPPDVSESLANIVDTAMDAIIVINGAQRILLFNKAAEKTFGYSWPEVKHERIELLIPERFRIGHEGMVHDYDRSGGLTRSMGVLGRIAGRRANGEEFPAEASISRTTDDGRTLFTVILRDITTQVQREEGLRRTEEQSRHAQRLEAVGRLAGGIAHDFNNILTIITNYCELIDLESANSPAIQTDIDAIRAAAIRAADLVRNLLAFGRKQVLNPSVIDLNAVVTSMERMLRRLIGEDVIFVVDLDPKPEHIYADAGQIEQVIINLALNARDAMPTGGALTLSTRTCQFDDFMKDNPASCQPGSYAVLSISDTGVGMDDGTLACIFEPFFTTKEIGGGTGLGLASVYGIVKQSGGGISVHSVQGAGTTFDVYLPLSVREATAKAKQLARGSFGGTETILIIEDEHGVLDVTRDVLEAAGYQILEAQDGAEAIRISNEYAKSIDLMLTDVVMPAMSGVDTAKRILERRPGTKVIFMTGYTEDAVSARGFKSTEYSLLLKPFRTRELVEQVRRVLDGPARYRP